MPKDQKKQIQNIRLPDCRIKDFSLSPRGHTLFLVFLTLSACSNEKTQRGAVDTNAALGGESSYWTPEESEDGPSAEHTDDDTDNPWQHGLSDLSNGLEPSVEQDANTPPSLGASDEAAGENETDNGELLDSSPNSKTNQDDSSDSESEPTSGEPPELPNVDETESPPSSEPPGSVTDLQISGYKEGTGADKRLLLINNGEQIDETCAIEIYSNGGTKPWRSWALPVPILDAAEVVLCTVQEESPTCNHTISGSGYNGNDALVLRCTSGIIDSFGRVGEDPSPSWSNISPRTGELVSTKDAELIRCESENDTTIDDFFDIAEQWVNVLSGEDRETALERCSQNPELGQGGAGGPN